MRSALIFVAVAALSFSILVWAWPALREPYSVCFEGVCESAARPLGVRRTMDIEVQDGGVECSLALTPGRRERWRASLDVFRIGYLPTSAFLALGLAGACVFGFRCLRFGVGLLLVHLYPGMCVGLAYLSLASTHAKRCERHVSEGMLGEEWLVGLSRKMYGLVQDPGFLLTVPLLVWAVVVLDRNAWHRVVPILGPAVSSETDPQARSNGLLAGKSTSEPASEPPARELLSRGGASPPA